MESNEMQGNTNMIPCPICGKPIAKKAKKCPHCGAKMKKPIYKRVWFIILCVIVLIGIIGTVAGGGGDETAPASNDNGGEVAATEEVEIEYTAYDVSELNADLEANAVNAKDKYCDQYVALTGKLESIDSDGSYISLTDPNDEWDIVGVTCYIMDDSQLEKVKKASTGDVLTVKGKITDVGEVLGYSLDIDEIE